MNEHIYAIVLAGGKGTRLWPESRRTRPKQFCRLGDSAATMLELTLSRLDGFIPAARRAVVTQQEQYDETVQLLSSGIGGEVIAEPEGRGTLAAASLATLQLAARDPQAVIVSMHCDALIKDVAAWQRAITLAIAAAQRNSLVLLGAKPHYAECGYDYIERGAALSGLTDTYRARFHHRPSADNVKAYVRQDGYFWNSGIFVWRADIFLQELQRTQPQTFTRLSAAVADRNLLPKNYAALETISIDAGIFSVSDRCALVPVDCGWLDIGSWDALAKVFSTDARGNLAFGRTLMQDCRGTTVKTDGVLVATLGLQDVIVVATADAVLVCAKEHAQAVRNLVAHLPEEFV